MQSKKKQFYSSFFDIKMVKPTTLNNIIKKSKYVNVFEKTKMVINELRKVGFVAELVPLPLSSKGIYWTDYPPYYLEDVKGITQDTSNVFSFIVYMDEEGKSIVKSSIKIDFPMLGDTMKKFIKDIFMKYLPNRYEWSGINDQSMFIHYKPLDKKLITSNRLDGNEDYRLYIKIYTKRKDLTTVDITKLESFKEIMKLIKTPVNYNWGYDTFDITIYKATDPETLFYKIKKVIDLYKNNKDKELKIIGFNSYYIISNEVYQYTPNGFVKDKKYKFGRKF